jgi:hypothetical protein
MWKKILRVFGEFRSRWPLLLSVFLLFKRCSCRKNVSYSSNSATGHEGFSDNSFFRTGDPQQPLLAGYNFGVVELPTLAPVAAGNGLGYYPISPVPPYFCRSTTDRAHLDCPCRLIGIHCLQKNSICTADPNGDGFCACAGGFLPSNGSCVTLAYYNRKKRRQIFRIPPIENRGFP